MTVSEFYKKYRNRHQLAKRLKQSGKKIFGYFCLCTPQELIYAADIVPVRIRGSMDEPTLANAFLPGFVCCYQRSCLHEALAGNYGYLDGVIFSQRCDINRDIGGIWAENVKIPYSWQFAMPRKHNESAIDMFAQELGLFKSSLEQYCGHELSDESLRQAIDVYNKNRSLRRQVYQLFLEDVPPLLGSQVFEIMMSGLIMPKEEHSKMLSTLLGDLPSRGKTGNNPRLLVTGNTLENIEVLRTVERCGGEIVIDDFCFGTRDCWRQVDHNSDPLRSIAEYYLSKRIPGPCTDSLQRKRIGHILELVEDYRVQGVIQISQHYCDNYLFETPVLHGRLKEQGVPMLNMEIDDTEVTLARIEANVQAFIEMLK